jgi:hypothetical protein
MASLNRIEKVFNKTSLYCISTTDPMDINNPKSQITVKCNKIIRRW